AALGGLFALLPLYTILVTLSVNLGCVYFAWHGYKYAKQGLLDAAAHGGRGLAYAHAGRIVNGFFGLFNVLAGVLLIGAFFFGGKGGGGGVGGLDLSPIMDMLKKQ